MSSLHVFSGCWSDSCPLLAGAVSLRSSFQLGGAVGGRRARRVEQQYSRSTSRSATTRRGAHGRPHGRKARHRGTIGPHDGLRMTGLREAGFSALDRRQPLGGTVAPPEAGKRGGKATAKARKALLNAFHVFPFQLANTIVHEPRRQAASPAALVQRLYDRHGLALVQSLKRWKIPHARSASPLVTVPFLLAGYYLVNMFSQLARPPHRPNRAFLKAADEGLDALREGWGSVAFARTLFSLERDRDAWFENCGAAEAWIEKLIYAPHPSLALVRRCENPKCPAPFGGARGPRASRACSGRCRQALLRARAQGHRPRRHVTIQRSKQKDSGPAAPRSARATPLISPRPTR